MQVLSFPGCCTAKVLVGFGQSNTAQYGIRGEHASEAAMKAEVDKHLRSFAIGKQNGLVFVAVTSSQKMALKVLPEMGFQGTGSKTKKGHSETTLHGFWINPAEYLEVNKPPAPPKRYKVGLVKDLKPVMALSYRRLRDQWWGYAHSPQDATERALTILTIPENFTKLLDKPRLM